MTLRQRILVYYSITVSLSLLIVGFWSWFEFREQRDAALRGGSEAALRHDPLEETLEIILYGGLPALLLGIVGGSLLMRRALRPIGELTEALEGTDVSNLSDAVPRSGNGDELDRMTAVFNRMKERLDLSFTQVREFTLHASHELKTPLTIMHGTLEQMFLSWRLEDANKESVSSLLEEVQRLSTIVGQLSFLARADAGMMSLNRERVALHELVRDLVEEVGVISGSSGLAVSLKECAPAWVVADRMRLRQVFLNLADNAVKYNEPGGSIEIELRRSDNRAEFTIRNTGAVLEPERRARVFDRFFRGDLGHHGEIEGSGLGLSIARSIVEAHDGELRYEVLPDGRTEVTVVLRSPD